LQDLFDVLDEDDSGSISRKEFKKGLSRQKIYLSRTEIGKVFRVVDPVSRCFV
jgi:Ca2+-binding EF-hand superfamily protein